MPLEATCGLSAAGTSSWSWATGRQSGKTTWSPRWIGPLREDGRLLVRPRGLIADATYEVVSLDTGPIGAAPGEALMRDGIELVHAGGSRAHVLVLRPQD
jgi:hypothetical protein